jgi:glutamate racemase
MNRASLPIGVFDSGLGGLTVVKELRRLLPAEKVIYVGDTARVPYGTKSPDTIRRYAMQIAFFLLQKKVKTLVVACNSASATALETLKDLPIPVMGVIDPGSRAAVLATSSLKIGVIGTKATVASRAYPKAIRAYAPKARIYEQACPLLVPLVEEGWTENPVTQTVVDAYLKPMRQAGVDTLVLGCTHYPLLKKAIRKTMGAQVKLIDSGEETAKGVRALLEKNNLLNPSKKIAKPIYYVTDNPESFSRLGGRFLGKGKMSSARRLSLELLG